MIVEYQPWDTIRFVAIPLVHFRDDLAELQAAYFHTINAAINIWGNLMRSKVSFLIWNHCEELSFILNQKAYILWAPNPAKCVNEYVDSI